LVAEAQSLRMSNAVAASQSSRPTSPAQKALQKLGLARDIDLALHLPFRYEDETRITRLADARDGETVQIEARVLRSEVVLRPRRQLKVEVDDGSDTCVLRFLNFYPAHQKTLSEGALVRLRGELRGGFLGREIVHPSFKLAGGELPQALTPVYPSVAQLPQAYLRKAVLGGLGRADLSETLPAGAWPAAQGPAWTLQQALTFLHQPSPQVSLAELDDRSHPAWQRLKAEELLAQQLSQLQARRARDAMRSPVLKSAVGASGLHERLMAALPFRLTAAQQRVEAQVGADLLREQPMHRLLQGDVGSGKTVVAALAALRCIEAGWQCALMAPTEILAEQHFRKLVGWLEPLLGIVTAWLTGSQKAAERRAALAAIASGQAQLVVGTHAVIESKVQFARLALAIIDEQHRFGVAQRLALRSKMTQTESGQALEPHLLMMSATPIPRTLAMSYYADLDVSTIDELPPGRSPIVTKVVNQSRREEVIERIRAQLGEGRQVYWVCPLIEESEALDLRNATETHADLAEALPGVMVGLLHSRMPAADKKAVMAALRGRADGGAGLHHRDRGRRGRAQCLPDGDRACRTLWPVAAAPAARSGGPRRGGLGLRADVFSPAMNGRLGDTAQSPTQGHGARPMTASRSPGATWTFAALASFWGPGSQARRCCVLPTWRLMCRPAMELAREAAPRACWIAILSPRRPACGPLAGQPLGKSSVTF
jgi:ATP-dependent DNA helicase RecG